MIDMHLHMDEEASEFTVELKVEHADDDDIIIALAGVIDAFELLKDKGIGGTAVAIGKAVSVAELMLKNHDNVTRVVFEN